jgi:hypothetical protein
VCTFSKTKNGETKEYSFLHGHLDSLELSGDKRNADLFADLLGGTYHNGHARATSRLDTEAAQIEYEYVVEHGQMYAGGVQRSIAPR